MKPKIFQSDQFGSVRILYEEGKPLFCGADACKALGYKDSVNAMKRHCHGVVKRHLIDSKGRKQQASFLPEGDLYRLICHSKLPSAEQFERWVFDEVLPSLRKDGEYATKRQQAYAGYLESRDNRLNAQILMLGESRKRLNDCCSLRDEVFRNRDQAKAEFLKAKARYGKFCDLARQTEDLVKRAQSDIDTKISLLEQMAADPLDFESLLTMALPQLA